jgi:hypothetical protein
MILSVDEKLFSVFPELKIGAIFCEIENKIYGQDRL